MIKKPKKSLGQNFLIDLNVIKKIVNLANIKNDDYILEVGPGTGNLTNEIIKKNPKKIFLVEKDNFLSKQLLDKFKEVNVEVFNSDILNFNEDKIAKKKLLSLVTFPTIFLHKF